MITIFTIPKCWGCKDSIAFCKLKNIPHEIFEMTTESDIKTLKSRIGDNRNIQVPFIMKDTTIIGHLPELRKWYINSL